MRRMVGRISRKDGITRLREMVDKNADTRQWMEKQEQLSGFSKKEIEEVKDIFRYFDKDRNKHLDKKECRCLISHQLGCCVDESTFNKVFEKMDENKDGAISFPEYLRHLSSRKKKLPANYELREIFEAFDRNEDGRLNMNDFRHALLYMGEDAGRPDLRSIFVRHDGDKDGLISKYEFEDAIHSNFAR